MRLGHNSKIDLIKRVPLFSAASKQELAEIASIADEIDLPEGKVLIKEGDAGREFFVLIDGTADVERGGKKVAGDRAGRLLRRDLADLEDAAERDDHDDVAGARARDHRPGVPFAAGTFAADRRSASSPRWPSASRRRRSSRVKERMLRGELYIADDPQIEADQARAHELMERYNATRHAEQDERDRLLRELLGEVGEGVVVRPPFRCDYGSHISIGAGTFVNFDCVMLDVAPIRIGAACQLATGVQLLTATHPIDPEPRRLGWEYAKPITIGDNVWLGGGVIVCPGVTIGDNTVVGAGAVVTRDLPADVVAFGNPARVQRSIDERDRVDVPDL